MEDDGGGGGRSRRYDNASTAGLTLGGILSIKETPPYRIQNRTLLDHIRDDQTCGKKTWKMFREKLRLKLVGSVCTTTVPILASHVHVTANNNRTTATTRNGTNRSNSPPVNSNSTSSVSVTQTENVVIEPEPLVEERDQMTTTTEENRRGGGQGGEPAPVKVSLMSLLEVDGSVCFDDEEEEKAEEEVAVVDGGVGGDGGGYRYNNCCVCMVRHKGAAFIPCGHTFCRLCSRELFVKRANCPLCNNFISQILDIF